MSFDEFEKRKLDHLRHALDESHQAVGESGLAEIHLGHEALPDLDFNEVRLESTFFDKPLATPFYIAGMTAGHPGANELNQRLATACAERGWALGLGSQRRELEESGVDRWAALKEISPTLVLIGNLGITQALRTDLARLGALVASTGASALALHLNPLQECLQPEGTPQFRGAFQWLSDATRDAAFPLVLKETGSGFSDPTLRRLRRLRLAALDVSGLGGTHWGRIEGARAAERASDDSRAQAARTFAHWGESTVSSVMAARERLASGTEVWASGGVRSGLDAAKLIALGASKVGYAKPALEAAQSGLPRLRSWMEQQELELRIALFCTGCAHPDELRARGGELVAPVFRR